MHMAFLSRVFKNLQWYGMTQKALEPSGFKAFLFCVLQAFSPQENPLAERKRDICF